MKVFIKNNYNLSSVKEAGFKFDKDLQKLVEDNIVGIFGYDKIRGDVMIGKEKIDTLAFDYKTKSFALILYKNFEQSDNLGEFSQYHLDLLMNNIPKFMLELVTYLHLHYFDPDEVNWNLCKIIIISSNFNNKLDEIYKIKNPQFEFWEAKKFQKSIYVFNQINPKNLEQENTENSENNQVFEEYIPKKEKPCYTREHHQNKANPEIFSLYEDFEFFMFEQNPNIDIVYNKNYVSIKLNNTSLLKVILNKTTIKIIINENLGFKAKISKKISRNRENILIITDSKDLLKVKKLIEKKFIDYI